MREHLGAQPVTIMATTSTAPTSTTTTPVDTATIIANLQHQLQIVEQERDDLARDVEALCMSGADPSGISSSSVVSERIRIQDEQLADHRTRLAVALADAASLREDNAALRDSKRVADQGWRTESQRAADLERELQFYQTQSARAMSDRDRATWEADELRRRVDDLEQALERERGLFLAEQGQRQQAEAAGASAQEQIAALRIELKGLDVVPGLRTTIARLETETQQLQESLGSVQEELARRVEEVEGLKRRLEQVQGQLQGARDGNAKLEKKVASAKEKHAAEVFQLQSDIAALSNDLFAARAAQDELDASLAAAHAELDVQKAAVQGGARKTQQAVEEAVRAVESRHAGEVQALKEQVGAGEKEVEGLRSALDAAKAQVNALENKLNTVNVGNGQVQPVVTGETGGTGAVQAASTSPVNAKKTPPKQQGRRMYR